MQVIKEPAPITLKLTGKDNEELKAILRDYLFTGDQIYGVRMQRSDLEQKAAHLLKEIS